MDQKHNKKQIKKCDQRVANSAIKLFTHSRSTCTATSLICFWSSIRNALEVSRDRNQKSIRNDTKFVTRTAVLLYNISTTFEDEIMNKNCRNQGEFGLRYFTIKAWEPKLKYQYCTIMHVGIQFVINETTNEHDELKSCNIMVWLCKRIPQNTKYVCFAHKKCNLKKS